MKRPKTPSRKVCHRNFNLFSFIFQGFQNENNYCSIIIVLTGSFYIQDIKIWYLMSERTIFNETLTINIFRC